MPCWTRKSAMSPTTLLDGVTFTMSPKARLTSAYVRAISLPACAQPHALGLLLQIRVLAARHLVQVDVGRAGCAARCRTARTTSAPSPSNPSSGSAHRSRARCRARDRAAARRRSSSDSAGWSCRSSRRWRASATSTPASAALRIDAAFMPAGVVRVEVDRHADLLAQRLHQLVGRVRLAAAPPCP